MATPKDANERLLDLAVRHRIGLERLSTSTVRRVLAQIRRVEIDVLGRIAARSALGRSDGNLTALLGELRSLYVESYRPLTRGLQGDLFELAGYEAEFQAKALGSVLSVQTNTPILTQVVAAVNARPFQGRLLQGWLDDLPVGAASRVQEAIRQGFIEGESTDSIIKRIRGTKAAKYRDGLMEISRRGAESLVRTAVTHIASVAQEETYAANADVLDGVEWVSVLDSRTTPICQSRDGKVYAVGRGPRPPAHIRCRSTTIGRVKGSEPPPRLIYGEWLKRQPPSVQNEVLGKTRGDLFRTGKVPVDRFTDPAGNQLTLEQLQARESAAFSAARIGGNGGAGSRGGSGNGRKPWPWDARKWGGDLSVDTDEKVLSSGLLPSRTAAADLARMLVSGVPEELSLGARWQSDGANVRFGARASAEDGETVAQVQRTFFRKHGRSVVAHDYFRVDGSFQRQGGAKRMMQNAVIAYDDLGQERVEVHAALNVGGYAWASLGFAAQEPSLMRQIILDRAERKLENVADVELVRQVVRRSSDLTLMADIAGLRGSGDRKVGKDILLGSDWWGYIDLTDERHRALLRKLLK